ncbi:MAG: hypothetical protein M9931_00690 [Chitinophagales bacterium]|nr:hypothetical protein [Chitinophagales bacterium]
MSFLFNKSNKTLLVLNQRNSSNFFQSRALNGRSYVEDFDPLNRGDGRIWYGEIIPSKDMAGRLMTNFSQLDPNTSLDYRKYNLNNPNRTVPYYLPKEIQDKIFCLLQKINLNFGVIDLILTEEGEYYFLEVNPVGQFGFVSKHGNYYIEKEIANYLSK